MHVVLVLVTVKPELLDEFERALLHNARESVRRDPGCIRFDVSQQAYDAVASRALVDKTVIRATGKHTT
jgi:quinol monooxygenase YgiN